MTMTETLNALSEGLIEITKSITPGEYECGVVVDEASRERLAKGIIEHPAVVVYTTHGVPEGDHRVIAIFPGADGDTEDLAKSEAALFVAAVQATRQFAAALEDE